MIGVKKCIGHYNCRLVSAHLAVLNAAGVWLVDEPRVDDGLAAIHMAVVNDAAAMVALLVEEVCQ